MIEQPSRCHAARVEHLHSAKHLPRRTNLYTVAILQLWDDRVAPGPVFPLSVTELQGAKPGGLSITVRTAMPISQLSFLCNDYRGQQFAMVAQPAH
jgi:hypothetical protein